LMIARVHIRNPITNVSTVVNALLDTGNTSPFLSKRVRVLYFAFDGHLVASCATI